MFTLSYTENGLPRRHLLRTGETLVGRSPECDLLIDDVSISRRHAAFEVSADRCIVRDLGSRNGTYQNGDVVTRSTLAVGDTLMLGQIPVLVHVSLDDRLSITDDQLVLDGEGTLYRSVAQIGAAGVAEASVDAGRLLKLLSDIGRLLIEADTLADMLERVVQLVFDCVPAERCFLLLGGEGDAPPIPRVVRQRDAPGPTQAAISRTIIDRVMTDRVALLAANAQVDPRLGGGESIRVQNIRAFMCAPLWNRTDVIGVLYADSPDVGRFTAADLDLFTALSNYAAVAIERARLTESVLEETRRRERLQRYHCAAVVEQILSADLDGDASFIAEERDVSVLFADLVGFTTRAERLSPREVSQLLNTCLASMSEAVFEQDGTLDKFIGDALLAVFGAPFDQPDHHLRAVRAAQGIRRRLSDLNRSRGDDPLAVRIAINSGLAMAGDIGSQKRREYTVLGDVVNTASRLQSEVATAGQIVIGRATYDHVKDQICTRPLGEWPLRGRSVQVEVFEVGE
jgi:adenylate cyclase